MAYISKVSAVAAVLILAVVAFALPTSAEPQTPMFPKIDPECATVMPDLLEKCFSTVRVTPTDECCSDLKSATETQVTCLCDNYIANPSFSNITGPYADGITTKCGVLDKYSCDGTSKGGEEKKEEGSSSNSSSSSNGKDNHGNGGRANKVAASMAIFGFVANLFFIMF